MFYKLNFYQKVITLCLLYAIVFSISFYLFKFSLQAIKSWEIILFNFLQVWDLMLVGFLFFQTFKYVRLPKIYYLKRRFETETFFRHLKFFLFMDNFFDA